MKGLVERLGLRVLGSVSELGRMGVFVGGVVRAGILPRYRVRRFVEELYDVGVLSLAIICLSGLTVGAVLALQGYYNLARFGAEGSLGAVVGLVLVRELGPVLTALLVTGRAASAMAAQIATMVTTEQLDGLRMMSVDPLDFVISPKAKAMAGPIIPTRPPASASSRTMALSRTSLQDEGGPAAAALLDGLRACTLVWPPTSIGDRVLGDVGTHMWQTSKSHI